MTSADNLHTGDLSDSTAAPAVFGMDPGLLVAIPRRGWAPYILVPEGFYALVTNSGAEIKTDTGSPVWQPGFTFAGPFTRISHLVTKSYCVFNIPVKGCKLSCNTSVTIDCSMVFRIMGDESKGEDPELVRTFVHEVTPAGLQQLLNDAMAEEIRTLARSLHHTEVYAARSGFRAAKAQAMAAEVVPVGDKGGKGGGGEDDPKMQGIELGESKAAEAREPDEDEAVLQKGVDVTLEMKERLNAEFNKNGVQIYDIMIQGITLPDNITQQMSNRTMVRSKQEYEMMEQKFEMQSIRLKNEVDKTTLDHKEAQDICRVEGARDIQASNDALLERMAVRGKFLADYKQGTATEVSKIKAEMKEATTKLDYEYHQALQTLNLQAEEESKKIEAETSAKMDELVAETGLQIAQLEAAAKTAMASAEKDSNAYLAKSRELQLRGKHLDVYESLAKNPEVVLSDSSKADFNMLLLADNVLGAHGKASRGQGGGGAGHASLAAELNMLRLASAAYGLKEGDRYIPDGLTAAANANLRDGHF